MSFIRYFLIVVAGLLLLLVLMYFNANTIRDKLNPDTMMITTIDDINRKKLQVRWTSEGQNDTLTIYKGGTIIEEDYKAAGLNYFLIYYKDELIGDFTIFKTEAWHGHEYQIEVGRDSTEQILVSVAIIGPDAHR